MKIKPHPLGNEYQNPEYWEKNIMDWTCGDEGQSNRRTLCWVQVLTWVWVQNFIIGSHNYGVSVGIRNIFDYRQQIWICTIICLPQKEGIGCHHFHQEEYPLSKAYTGPRINQWYVRSRCGNHQRTEIGCFCRQQNGLYGCTGGFTAHLTHYKKLGYQQEGGCSEKVLSRWRISTVSIWWSEKLVMQRASLCRWEQHQWEIMHLFWIHVFPPRIGEWGNLDSLLRCARQMNSWNTNNSRSNIRVVMMNGQIYQSSDKVYGRERSTEKIKG